MESGFPWRAGLPFVLPFGAFMVCTAFETQDNYVVAYSVKIALVTALWWFFRGAYPRSSGSGVVLGVVVGAVGLPVWVLLSGLSLDQLLPEAIAGWVASGDRVGFDPFTELGNGGRAWGFIALRLFGLAVTVPLMEEVFWRGFLLRFLIEEQFQTVAIGRYTRFSFAGVTLLFALVHPEFVAALVWGAGVNWLLYRTKNLWACIAAHATTNLLLGVYVLATGHWGLW